MLQTRCIPCLLLKNKALVKTVQFKNPSYIGDPVNAIKIFNEKEVDELILLDISATPDNRDPQFQLLAEIAGECFMPLTYGGGIKTLEHARKLFTLGIEKLSINSYALENPSFIREISSIFGSQSIVISIDFKKNLFGSYSAWTFGGTKKTKYEPVALARLMEDCGAGEILLTSIDRDGTWNGYDLELIQQVTSAVSIPVIACGGAGNIGDLKKAIKSGGASAAGIGSLAVYLGKGQGILINFPTANEQNSIMT